MLRYIRQALLWAVAGAFGALVAVVLSGSPASADDVAPAEPAAAAAPVPPPSETPVTDLVGSLTGPVTEPVTDAVEPLTSAVVEPVDRALAPVTRPVAKTVETVAKPVTDPVVDAIGTSTTAPDRDPAAQPEPAAPEPTPAAPPTPASPGSSGSSSSETDDAAGLDVPAPAPLDVRPAPSPIAADSAVAQADQTPDAMHGDGPAEGAPQGADVRPSMLTTGIASADNGPTQGQVLVTAAGWSVGDTHLVGVLAPRDTGHGSQHHTRPDVSPG